MITIQNDDQYRRTRKMRNHFITEVRLQRLQIASQLGMIRDLEGQMRVYEAATDRELTGRTRLESDRVVAIPSILWPDFEDWLLGRGLQAHPTPDTSGSISGPVHTTLPVEE